MGELSVFEIARSADGGALSGFLVDLAGPFTPAAAGNCGRSSDTNNKTAVPMDTAVFVKTNEEIRGWNGRNMNSP